jgi:phosphoserine phosphatase RsbU/P
MTSTLSKDDYRDKLIFTLSALDDMGELLTQPHQFEYTAKYLLRVILGSIGITKGAVYIYLSEKERLKLVTATLSIPETARSLDISGSDALKLANHPDPVKFDDIKKESQLILGPIMQTWRDSGVEVLAPLAIHEELIGFICLGSSFVNPEYARTDLEILQLLTRHVSVSFYNNKLLKETQKANFKLNRKILEMEQINEVGLAIVRLRSPREMLDEILSRASSILDARYGAFWRKTEESLHLACSFGFDPEALPPLMQKFQSDPGAASEITDNYGLSVPITVRDNCFGCLTVAGKESRSGDFRRFTGSDRLLLSSFANQAGVALENAHFHAEALEKELMEKELEIALEIQNTLLPQSIPAIPGLDIAAQTMPCRTVGGDFFDIEQIPGGGVVITIADVSGKGVPAAMLVSTYHAIFHMLKPKLTDLEDCARQFNKLIYEATPGNKFISAAFMIWYPDRSEIALLTAGHDPLLLIRKNGSMETISEGGLILGLFPHAVFTSQRVPFETGDLLCMYTDGITDLRNASNEQFGLDRLKQITLDHHTKTSTEILNTILESCENFRGNIPAPDDQTLLIIRRPEE